MGSGIEPHPSLDAELQPGDLVGEYAIVAKIGEGGFGTVYRAEHPVIGKHAAIKVLSLRFSADGNVVSRFVDEARAVNQIDHRNIIDIFSFGTLPDGRFYYVMELLEGDTLDRALAARGRFAPEEAIRVLAGVARALDAAHDKGIIHRDLKPENVFVTLGPDQEPFPKLLDFGIAKLLGDTTTRRTQTGAPIGTPYYMSPEQCRATQVDHRTDVYSFGVVAFELLAGRLPFRGETQIDVMTQHLAAPPPRLSEVCPDLPPGLDAPLLAMLAKQPEQRPVSVGEALRQLAVGAQRAGIAVDSAKLELRATPAGLANRPRLDTSVRREFESAPTVGQASTTLGAQTAASRSSGSRWLVAGGALAIAVVVAVLAVGLSRPDHQAAPVASEVPVASVAAAPVAKQSSAPAPSASHAPPAEPRVVQLTIDSRPPRVTVKRGDELLGSAPGPFELPEGADPIALTFEAPGYRSSTVKFTPSEDATLPVDLPQIPVGRPSSARRTSSDLEF